jgi:hypothetical protein
MQLPEAERINYWQTSKTSPDGWLLKARALIENIGGVVVQEAYGNDLASQRAAYMIRFRIAEDCFEAVWPVLPTRTGNEPAARRQAATLLYHDIKAKCLAAVIKGARRAFFEYWLLPDGRPAVALSGDELAEVLPAIFLAARNPGGRP